MKAVLLITTIYCAVQWLKRYISTGALLYYMEKNGYKLPSEEELKECTQWVAKEIFKP